jgi:hypothetical protein
MRLHILKMVLLVLFVCFAPASVFSQAIISKQEADRIFSMTKPEWEEYVQKVAYPSDWQKSLSSHDTGTAVMAFDRKTGHGLLVQPLYRDYQSPPEMVIVGRYYPEGSLPRFTETLKREIEEATKKDLGIQYSVSARYAKLPGGFEGIELTVMQLQK